MPASAVMPARGETAGGWRDRGAGVVRRAAAALREVAAGRRGRWRQIALGAVVALIVLRIAAPYVITAVINRQLDQQERIRGGIDGVSLALIRGVYEVHGLHLHSRQPGAEAHEPLLYVTRVRCALHWSQLLRGNLAGDLLIERPVIHLRPAAPTSPAEAPVVVGAADGTPPSQRWDQAAGVLDRIRLDDIRVSDGRIVYTDQVRGFTAWMGDVQGRVRDLSLNPGSATRTVSFHVAGGTIGEGRFGIEGIVTPAAENPDLLLRAAVEGVELGKLNPISRHFDGLTFNSGTFSGYAEMSVSDGRLSGYFKPLFRHLDIASYRQDQGSAATRLFWRAAVPVAENVLDNEAADQHAARIPITGSVDDPRTSLWSVVGSALGNAFGRALVPGFDGFSGAKK